MDRTPANKHCIRCNQVYPCTTEYWNTLDVRGEPVGQICRVCKSPQSQAAYELEKVKTQNVRAAVSSLIAVARANRMDCPDFMALTTTLVAEFGGVEAYCKELVQQIREAKPGSRTRIEGMYAVAKMIDRVSSQTQTRVEDLSDEELQEEMAQYLQTRIGPQLLLMAPEDNGSATATA